MKNTKNKIELRHKQHLKKMESMHPYLKKKGKEMYDLVEKFEELKHHFKYAKDKEQCKKIADRCYQSMHEIHGLLARLVVNPQKDLLNNREWKIRLT